jgi:hypothetical protein
MRLGVLVTRPHMGLLYQPWMADERETLVKLKLKS